jgi:hypothetical protein
MLEEIRTKIARETSGGLAFEELRELYEIDRWFTFPAFEKSARHLADAWKAAGCSAVKVERFPADGRTLAGSWKMPLAWDAREAVLSVEYPEELRGTVIARYSERPTSLMMWSAPTPKKGITAELIYLADADVESSYRKTDVRGRIVFTSARGAFAKGLAARHGAAGIVSDFVTARLEKPDATFWTNAWSDDAGGWGLTAEDSRLFGFAVTPSSIRGSTKAPSRR